MNIAKQRDFLLNEIKVLKPGYFQKYKQVCIDEFLAIKNEEGVAGNEEFFDVLINDIKNSENEDELNQIVFHDFFLNEDQEGLEDFINDMKAKIT
jgi:hypothetical protein